MALARLFFDNDTDFDRMLSARLPVFSNALQNVGSKVTPRFDILQKDDTVTVLAEIPGVKREDVKIDLSNDRLTISGSTKEEKEYEDEAHVTHRERSFGSFTRALQVPAGIKPEDVKASMDNGVLKIVLPAKPKEPAATSITIS